MRPLLVVHVANTAMRIMSARYPEDLIRRPLPPDKTCGTAATSDERPAAGTAPDALGAPRKGIGL
jgi:hypothetical protein